MSSKKSISQNNNPVTHQFDRFGWPINPATGETYTHSEIVTNPTIPYPQHVNPQNPGSYWRRIGPEQYAAQQAKIAKKSKSRKTRANRRRLSASAVLANMTLSGAERQRRSTARATAELVERVNGGDEQPKAHDTIFLCVAPGVKIV